MATTSARSAPRRSGSKAAISAWLARRLRLSSREYSLGSMSCTGVRDPSMAALRTRISSFSHRSATATASLPIASPSVRSSGAMVALPSASWIRSSTCSRSAPVRATRITCAPATPSASAVAAPIPRLAPVTSASLPESGFESVIEAASSGLAARHQRQWNAAFLLADVGQGRRIFAGEAGVAALRLAIVPLLAERSVQPFDRDESETVGIDVIAHLLDAHLRREQLRPLGRVDAVEAAVLGRRRGDAHVHFASAGIAHHLHDLHAGGAAHDGIVDEDDALAVDQSRIGVVLQLDAEVPNFLARLNEGPADIVRADDAELERNSRCLGEADCRRHAAIRHRHHIVSL